MSVVERCQYAVTAFSVTTGNPISSSYVRRRKMSVCGCIVTTLYQPLYQTSKDVSFSVASVVTSRNPLSSSYVRRRKMSVCGCIVTTLYQAAMSDVKTCYFAVALMAVSFVQIVMSETCIVGDAEWCLATREQAHLTGLIRTVISKRQRRRFLHTIPDTKHDSDSTWSAWLGGRQCWLYCGVTVVLCLFLCGRGASNNRFVCLCV